MKLLFITSPEQDILADSLLHGLRTLLGEDCVDYPRKAVMYTDFQPAAGVSYYGNLFTLWRILEPVKIDRNDVDGRIRANEFDVIIVGSVHRSLAMMRRLQAVGGRAPFLVLDGEDSRAVVAEGLRFMYFKRELDRLTAIARHNAEGQRRRLALPMPTSLLGLRPISFGIPREKIASSPVPAARRTRLFPRHIVDRQLATLVTSTPEQADGRGYVHASEDAYYSDLQTSLFGVTTKRAGWDCLRHYELGANGAIICFRALASKPPRCAPHGLGEGNALSYDDSSELLRKVARLSTGELDSLIIAAHRWACESTTETRALTLLDAVKASS
jgi:hypothetical protein